ncbi:MAG: GFA family protein [Hyphomonas sp.]
MKYITVERESLPYTVLDGGCHCGAVRYGISGRPLAVNACHCDDCKKLSGGPFGLYLHILKSELIVQSGTFHTFRRTGGSGNQISIERCSECGSRMWHLPDAAPDLVILCAGTLDDSTWAVPTSHIFIEDSAQDAAIARDALVVEQFQTTRQALWDRFSKIYPELMRQSE